MNASGPDPARQFWESAARRLCWRVNLAAGWERWTTPAVVASAIFAGALLTSRRHGVSATGLWLGYAATLTLCAAYATWGVRRRFFSRQAALAELDVTLALKTRLTAADAGIGPWPDPPPQRPRVLRWRLSRVLVPPAFAATLLAVAGFIPISKTHATAPTPSEPPAAWREMEDWLKGLEQQELASPETVETWEERVSKLRRQPESAWYSHGSLEAGDTLHEQLESGLRTLGSDLDQAADALDGMESVGGKSHETSAGGDEALDRAMQRLESGAVALHPQLLSKLKSAAGKSGKRLSMTELENLRRRLREGAGFSRLSIRECKAGHSECSGGVCLRRGSSGSGKEGAGRGGVSRGPGEAPMTLEEQASATDSTRLEGVSNEDLQNAALGDTVGMSRTAHEVERRRGAPVSGGTVSTRPGGGEAVWRDALSPEEQHVLERYFR